MRAGTLMYMFVDHEDKIVVVSNLDGDKNIKLKRIMTSNGDTIDPYSLFMDVVERVIGLELEEGRSVH